MDAVIDSLAPPLARPRPAWRMAVAAALVGHALTLGAALVWLRGQPPERLPGPAPVVFVSLGLATPADGGEPISLGAVGQALAATTAPAEAQVALRPTPPPPAKVKRPSPAAIPAAAPAASGPDPGPWPGTAGDGPALPGEAAPAEGGSPARGGPRRGLGSGEAGGGGPYLAGQVDQDPLVLTRVEPVYPALARRRNLSGRVMVRFRVDETGRVDQVTVVEARPEGVFEPAVLAALPRWSFKPGQRQGREVATWMILPVEFKLVD